MKTMSFLRSVIADARPRRPRVDSGTRPAAPDWTKALAATAHGDNLPSLPAADRRADISPAAHRPNRLDGTGRSEGPGAVSMDYPPAAFSSDVPDPAHDVPETSGSETGMVYNPASAAIGGSASDGALPGNRPDESGGLRLGPKMAMTSNEISQSDADAGIQVDFKPEAILPAAGRDEPGHGTVVSLGPIEHSAQADWDPSEPEPQPGDQVFESGISGAVLSQSASAVQITTGELKPDPQNAAGAKSVDEPGKGAAREVISPAARQDPAESDGDEIEPARFGRVPAPVDAPRQAAAAKTLDGRQYPETLAIENDMPAPVAKRTRQARRPHGPATAAEPAPPAAVSDDSSAQGRAVAGRVATGKAAAAPNRPVNPVKAQGTEAGPLRQSSEKQAVREKTPNRIAAQAEPASVRANVLPGIPVSRTHGRLTAGPARGTSLEAPRAPQVKIGQVDVFIEAPHRLNKSRPSPPPASHSLASRNYLRRL